MVSQTLSQKQKQKKQTHYNWIISHSGKEDTFYSLASFSFPVGNCLSLTSCIKFVSINHFELYWFLLKQEV